MPPLRRATRIYVAVLCLVVVGFALGGSWLSPPDRGSWGLAAACAAGVAVAWRFPFRYTFHLRLYADGALVMVATLLLEPPLACAAIALGAFVGNMAATPDDRTQAAFNGAQAGLTTASGALLLAAVGWDRSPAAFAAPLAVVAVAVAMAAMYLVTSTAVVAIIALESRMPITKVWRRSALREPIDLLSFVALGGLGTVAASAGGVGWTTLLMVPPTLAVVALLRASLRAQALAQVSLDGMTTSLAQAQRIAAVGSFEWDVATGVHRWSDQTYAILGVAHEPVPVDHDRFLTMVHPEDRGRADDALNLASVGGDALSVEVRIVRLDGSQRTARLQAELVVAPDGEARVIGVIHDVTEQATLRAELLHRASHDPLTGIANRAALVERLGHLLRPGPLAVDVSLVYLDLDEFKQTNDTHGHAAGDRLLVEVAARLQSCLGPGDLAARFGGDEFVVLLVGPTRPVEVRSAADRIGAAVRRPFDLDGRTIEVGASIGIAATSERVDGERLLHDADTALYQAKSAGKNRTVIHGIRLVVDPEDRRMAASTMRRLDDGSPARPAQPGSWTSYRTADGTRYERSDPTVDRYARDAATA